MHPEVNEVYKSHYTVEKGKYERDKDHIYFDSSSFKAVT